MIMSKKSAYKKIMNESSSKRVFSEKGIDEALPFSSPEAKQHVDKDLVLMSKYLGKASQQVIKTMMDGVKGGKYDAMDLARGMILMKVQGHRSEERRVGKECRSRWSPYH